MCGIAGYIGTRRLAPEGLQDTLRLMGRRGPDASAVRCWTTRSGRSAYLLHTRLGIIDLDERANQPFQSGPLWLACNGELYNYLEVRERLEALGRRFATTSDTEVLACALDEFGWSALDDCEGMWALAVYDERAQTLTLARDRFGEKPLYVYRDATGLYFGSEAKFIFALLGRRLPVNTEHLYRYLVNGYKSLYKTPSTFFVGLEELPPASLLTVDADGEVQRAAYWAPGADGPDDEMSYAEAVAGARQRLIRSVELRLRSDVPLAFCLSGGVDSNSLVAIARRIFGYDVHGFTIANADARYEEQELVQHAVAELDIRHTSIPVAPDEFLPRLRTLVRQHDAPVYTITYYAHWLLMAAIADHGYRISISGTAADELFTGYYDHHLAYLYEVRHEQPLHARSRQAWLEHVRPVVRNPFLQEPDAFITDPDMRDHVFLRASEFAGCLRRPWAEPFAERRYTGGLLRNRMMNELFHENVPVILHEDDLNAMYFSIENRSPFLDRELFEFCARIPTRHLIRDGRAKAVLRDAMEGLVPDAIRLNRRKVGFNAPLFGFLDVRNPEVRRTLLEDSPIFDHLDRSKVAALLDKDELPNSESKFLFYFLNSKLFLEEFGGRS